MKLRVVHVKDRKLTHVPEGWAITHTTCIEPKKGKPYFSVLMTKDDNSQRHKQKESAIGFQVFPEFCDEE